MHFTDPFHVSTRIADKCNDGTLLLQVLSSCLELIFLAYFSLSNARLLRTYYFWLGCFFSGHRPELGLYLESKQGLDVKC